MKEIIKKFAEEMEKIIDEKFEKYQDGWEEAQLYDLKHSLNEQFEKLAVNPYIPNSFKKTKRNLIHIANYCLFIFTKLNK